jgi:DNA mismatch repair protein MutS
MREGTHLSPMFRQYRAIKQGHPDAVLFFRMGDFYEMFYEDAKEASRLLELTLTARGKGTDNVVPMCGFPHHQLDGYTSRLVRTGRKVAVCEQIEDPRKVKGLVKRDVVRVVTPGTVNDLEQLDSKNNVWLASVATCSGRVGAAFLDASTGEFLAWQSAGDSDGWEALADQIASFDPREIVHPEDLEWAKTAGLEPSRGVLTAVEPFAFSMPEAARHLESQLSVASLDGFGLKDRPAAVAAAGGLLVYVQETQKCDLQHLDAISLHEPSRFVLMDPATRRNLEIERSLRDGRPIGSLLECIDRTVTPAGGRLLRRRLLEPLRDPREIERRLDSVDELFRDSAARERAAERLEGVHDIERLLGRAVTGVAHARDLLSLRSSIERLPNLVEALSDLEAPLTREIVDGLDPCEDLATRLAVALADEPPLGLREGGLIRDGFNADLDELRTLRRDGRDYIASLEAREREATGIQNLKVRFNKVFGYFIEVSKSNVRRVPEHYHRKQTVATAERYITPELKDYEVKVLNAQERIEALEYELFGELRREVAGHATRLKAAARAVARIDVLAGLAEVATRNDYRRPRIRTDGVLRIVGGRHPVVEQNLAGERFVANDACLDTAGDAIAILTGPNMGGKSTYLRQVALITLLAQAGSFVPADEAEVGVVDRIFCRVGASDSLADGHSTFMVEMAETANILHHATSRSLVLLDEIGRGTATFDGLSIAWAVVEFLHGRKENPPRTLFATHYHELTELAVELRGVFNRRMGVRERGDEVIFLHRVENGPADRSYGIHVARLAGVPEAVVVRAREILSNLEQDEYGRDGLPRRARRQGGVADPRAVQTSLFETAGPAPAPAEAQDPAAAEILAEMRESDPDRITPLEALQLVAAWRQRLRRDD